MNLYRNDLSAISYTRLTMNTDRSNPLFSFLPTARRTGRDYGWLSSVSGQLTVVSEGSPAIQYDERAARIRTSLPVPRLAKSALVMRNTFMWQLLAFFTCSLFSANSFAADDISIADFEDENYGSWKVTGEAFGPGPAQGTLPNQMDVTGYQGARRKVLIVDDVQANRAPVMEYLGHLGFHVLEADSGDAGVRCVQTALPDLVLMDTVMPVMDGMEAIRRIRAIERFRDLPIIVVSANASAADREASLAAGANAFLPKPISFERLLPEMARLLGLAWTLRVPDESAEPTHMEAAMVPPPADQMEALLRLARIGNMRSIQAQAEHLQSLDPRHGPLSSRLIELAQRFESAAIVELLKSLQESSVREGENAR